MCLFTPGQEFQAVFLSTTEPVGEGGMTLNPTKSPCDRYVFNTVLTRAKSLVVVVGSPRILLSTEQHMIKLYGDKGRCWSLYLKSCLEHGTLRIPQSVEPDQTLAQRFKEQLAAHLGATLPKPQSSRNYRMRDTNVAGVTSNTHTASGSKLATHSAQLSQPTAVQLTHRPLNSGDKQTSPIVPPVNLQTSNTNYPQSTVRKQPAAPRTGSVQAAPISRGIDESSSRTRNVKTSHNLKHSLVHSDSKTAQSNIIPAQESTGRGILLHK